MNTKTNRAQEQALAQVESIVEMVAALECDYDQLEYLRDAAEENRAIVTAYQEKMDDWQANATATEELEELDELEKAAGECKDAEEARERIQEDPLSVEVRSDWHAPGESSEPSEFFILLCTGGPAVRIIGDLDRGEPSRPRVEYQDWGTPWTEYFPTPEQRAAIESYCACFYFGE